MKTLKIDFCKNFEQKKINIEANWTSYLTSITTSACNFCASLIMYSDYSEKR